MTIQPQAPLIDHASLVFTEAMTGRPSPSPLQYAFSGKSSAHAGRGGVPPLSADRSQQTLSALLSEPTVSVKGRALYVHIPFCRVRCSFCNFFKYAASPKLMADYFQLLLLDLERKARQPWSQAQPFDAVYIGGGTPTDLSAEQIFQLGQRIQQLLPLTPDCEITLEGRLNKFDDAKFEQALAGGFNRFSFGVQSFDTQVRRPAKRLDDRQPLLQQLKRLTGANAATIAIDLMYGLPHQTAQTWQQDLQDTLEAGVDGVDLYQLIQFKGSGIERDVEQGRLAEPMGSAERALLYQQGANFLNKSGWKQLSYCHWASGDKEKSCYNAMAKSGAEILAVGAGAGGNLAGFGYMQPRDIEPWQQALDDQQWPVAMMMAKSPNHLLDAALVGACDRGHLTASAIGHARYKAAGPLFLKWQQHGLAQCHSDGVRLTMAGQFWSVNLANGMLQYLNQNQQAVEACEHAA
ncbi:heme anaerobic degradation radical SAM methyltransferase ChuW/HutW [Neiella marina]|uniref:Heme anaerobic degradation radical SAM methyltransferase ChuW/HutW n=1 Tax=Neiella holothuriorum TaxID=2870530 RepID=A0ABS7EGW6_9GAMM|nr:heme anaerobic degradation radical SAM methyltransferase ChuW/HutW [Neiella holothuriorum]MBW8191583.1 heme anaerobic degradation radical SAM methyltransferase ChuW/HutW [Neiella holothuriorum]